VLRALVIVPNSRTKQVSALLAIAKAESKKKEHSDRTPDVLALKFIPELGVYVALYEVPDVQKPGVGNRGDLAKR